MKLPLYMHWKMRQQGSTLIVSMIMLVLITFVVINAFNLSSTNLKAVGNDQRRTEAIAAASQYIEELIATGNVYTTTAPGGYSRIISLTGDTDLPINYTVTVAEPACVRAVRATESSPSDIELGTNLSGQNTWDVDFEFVAVVTDQTTGTSAELRQGVRARLSQIQRINRCGPIVP